MRERFLCVCVWRSFVCLFNYPYKYIFMYLTNSCIEIDTHAWRVIYLTSPAPHRGRYVTRYALRSGVTCYSFLCVVCCVSQLFGLRDANACCASSECIECR